MTLTRSLKWIAGVFIVPILLAVLFIAIFGWNWLRGPIERMALEKTGRQLDIRGDLELNYGWPRPHLHAGSVSFANPSWAKEQQMVAADAVDITIDLPQLLLRRIVLPEVRLEHPLVFLERGSGGRKNWLLDLGQQDEEAGIRIDRLSLDQGRLGYDDDEQKTSIRAELSTSNSGPAGADLSFTALGQYRGMPLKARGSGGPVLAMRDEGTPYALKVDASFGHTAVRADGTITSLLKFSALDMHLALSGGSLDQLFPLLGIAFPATHAYTFNGQLLLSENTWRYEKFSGRIGASDIAGSLRVDTGGKRPALKAEVASSLLDLDDLGPVIGSRKGSLQAARLAAPASAQSAASPTLSPAPARVLPDLPFRTDRWDSVDAEVKLSAKTIRRVKALPLEGLVGHLSLRDSVLTLDPLDFGLAGGQLNAVILLDGRKDPIQAQAQVKMKHILLAKLLPTLELSKTTLGQINGEFNLAGQGNSVGQMLARANGRLGLVVDGGKISKMMMEKAGLHLWEMLQLKITGDKIIKVRCAVADFAVKDGAMHANALIFDTEVTTIVGTGSIDLGQEQLDLTLNQNTKQTSPVALRSPIFVRGSFARPEVGIDKGRAAARGLGAMALGILNPLLVLIPLIDAGPGKDSDCGKLVRDAGK